MLFCLYAIGVLSNYVVAILRPTLNGSELFASFTATLVSGTVAVLLVDHIRRARANTHPRRRPVAVLDGFIQFWSLGIALIILEVWGRTFAEAPDFWSGFGRWQELVSPFNLGNYIVLVVLLLPVIGANSLSARLSRRTISTSPRSLSGASA